eukprot:scaffold13870_cov124-Isochrysis_galbana.AAC.2
MLAYPPAVSSGPLAYVMRRSPWVRDSPPERIVNRNRHYECFQLPDVPMYRCIGIDWILD